MKNLIKLAFLLLILSCGNKEYSNKTIKQNVHYLPFKKENLHLYIFKPVESNNSYNEVYITYRKGDSAVYKYSFDKKKVLASYQLSPSLGSIDDYLIHNDTLFAIKSPWGVALQPLNNPNGFKFYQLKNQQYGPGVYISYDADGLHINIMDKHILNNNNKLRLFYQNKIDAKIALEGDSVRIVETSINYPNEYAEHLNLNATYVNKANINTASLYSFMQSPEIAVVNARISPKMNHKPLTSNYYIKPEPFDTTRTFDDNYYQSYQSIYFMGLCFNNIRNELYRTMLHKPTKFDRTPFNGAWSLIVADTAFKIKYEVIFESGNYIYSKMVTTAKGFAFPVLPVDLEQKNQLILHEYELK